MFIIKLKRVILCLLPVIVLHTKYKLYKDDTFCSVKFSQVIYIATRDPEERPVGQAWWQYFHQEPASQSRILPNPVISCI